MKEYNDVKRAADAALRGLIRTIYSNLDEDDANKLCMELSLSLFSSTLDISLPVNKFFEELQSKSINYQLILIDSLIKAKVDFDKGEIDEDNLI